MLHRKILVCLIAIALSGCAALPSAHYDYLRDQDVADPAQHLDYLRVQSEQISGVPFVAGNQVTLLQNGDKAYPAMLAAIRSAKHRIDMESFTFDGKAGEQFARALLHQRRKGVAVNLIYDAIGSIAAPNEMFERLEKGGVKLVEYNGIDPISVLDTSINNRDHRKLLIVDGKTAFIGGINITEVYRLKLKLKQRSHIKNEDLDPEKTPWLDTQIKIIGPVAGDFEKFFMQVWQAQNGPPISMPRSTPVRHDGPLLVQALEETPELDHFKIYQSMMLAITLAQKSIHMTTGFFIPPPSIIRALKKAAQRGVDVTLLLPSQTDSQISTDAGHSYYEDLLESGVKIYEVQGLILHAKTAVIDGVWSTVGSSNLDWRSALHNNECNAVILGPSFGNQMEAMFKHDLTYAKRIDEEEWSQRSWGETIDEWRARFWEYFL